MADEEKKSFTVRDRRFSATEASPANKGESAEPKEKPADKEEPKAAGTRQDTDGSRKTQTQLPEINFATFVFSLNSSALVHLGLLEDPATGQKEKNLPLAKQTIDILGMLETKTRGNLSQDEANLLKNILYDLRIMYVKENR